MMLVQAGNDASYIRRQYIEAAILKGLIGSVVQVTLVKEARKPFPERQLSNGDYYGVMTRVDPFRGGSIGVKMSGIEVDLPILDIRLLQVCIEPQEG